MGRFGRALRLAEKPLPSSAPVLGGPGSARALGERWERGSGGCRGTRTSVNVCVDVCMAACVGVCVDVGVDVRTGTRTGGKPRSLVRKAAAQH